MSSRHKKRGQTIVEYLLMVVMLAVTVAVAFRGANFNIYCFWTGLARMIALPCVDCTAELPPGAEDCLTIE